ncbi:hypothetical protein GCM10022280_27110 [Sphingomonas swuensis]|uniref:ABC-2 type transporter transmembrane domain-containing protein n=1 Tax=Sphingomonas swuensis TaxID=977800 RepID=A0ABP7TDS5_9SPHN
MTLPPLGRLAAAFVIGRRDYGATVFSKTFLLFLLGPLFPILLVLLFGTIGARAADDVEQPRVAIAAPSSLFAAYAAAAEELDSLPGQPGLPLLERVDPATDPERLLQAPNSRYSAVLTFPAGRPHLTGGMSWKHPTYGQMKLLVSWVERGKPAVAELGMTTIRATGGTTHQARSVTARGAQALLFLLTLLLSTMLLSQLIEEKSNKVIEVLAAAVPVESIFIGKLFAMLCVSLTGILVWGGVALSVLLLLAPAGILTALPAPAVGWPAYLLLGAAYFTMSYLLIGGAFLAIGAQASTVREVQTLSMPITMSQVGLFALASFAIADMNGPSGIAAAVFPLSSPFAMIARGALDPALWPHLIAVAWQALWIALILKGAAAWFRRSVLSGPGKKPPIFRRRSATASR